MNPARNIVLAYWAAVHSNDFEAAGALLHDDHLLEWPQSGERIRGRAAFVAVNRNYPASGPWQVEVRRVIAEGQEVATEVGVTDGVIRATAITFFTVVEGRILRQVEYWPDPFAPAAWRAQWVEVTDGGER